MSNRQSTDLRTVISFESVRGWLRPAYNGVFICRRTCRECLPEIYVIPYILTTNGTQVVIPTYALATRTTDRTN